MEILTEGINYSDTYHTSVAQRFIEAQIVFSLWIESIYSFIFGSGLGAVIDGKYFIDDAVISSALLGGQFIHNIHLLPFALIHKYGLFGIVIMVFLVLNLLKSVKSTISNDSNDINKFWNILFILLLIYTIPAASHLWTSTLFWISLAMKKTKRDNMHRKILLIGPLSPPITGNSLANDIVIKGLKNNESVDIDYINTQFEVFKINIGKFTIKKAIFL